MPQTSFGIRKSKYKAACHQTARDMTMLIGKSKKTFEPGKTMKYHIPRLKVKVTKLPTSCIHRKCSRLANKQTMSDMEYNNFMQLAKNSRNHISHQPHQL